MSDARAFPAVSLAQAHALLTMPGSPFEMEECDVLGRRMRVWKNAPPTLREAFASGPRPRRQNLPRPRRRARDL